MTVNATQLLSNYKRVIHVINFHANAANKIVCLINNNNNDVQMVPLAAMG